MSDERSASKKHCQRRENTNYVRAGKSTGCFFFDFDYYDDEDEDDDDGDDDEAHCDEDEYDEAEYDSEYDEEDEGEDDFECCKGANGHYNDTADCSEEENYDLKARTGDCSILGSSSRKKHRSVHFYHERQTHRQLEHHRHHHQHQHHHHRHQISKNCCRRNSNSKNNNNARSVLINKRHNKYKIAQLRTKLEVIDELERSAGSGSDENDSLLAACNNISNNAAAVTV